MPTPTDVHGINKPLGNENFTRAAHNAVLDQLDIAMRGIIPMTTAQRDALTAVQKWPDRIIKLTDGTLEFQRWTGVAWTTDLFAPYVLDSEKGAASGIATLTAAAKLVLAQLPTEAARLDQAQTFAGTQTFAGRARAQDGFIEDLFDASPGADFAVDLLNGTVQRFTLTANRTITAISNPPADTQVMALTLLLKQDATGNRTVAWPASVKWPGGVAPALTATANRTDVVTLISHNGGAAWLGFVGGQNFSY